MTESEVKAVALALFHGIPASPQEAATKRNLIRAAVGMPLERTPDELDAINARRRGQTRQEINLTQQDDLMPGEEWTYQPTPQIGQSVSALDVDGSGEAMVADLTPTKPKA